MKWQVEKIRGRAVSSVVTNPLDIPAQERSDGRLLCQHPLVSVIMTAYNHERYIARAIQGVVEQKTNFEYELIVGEDCSSDKTREICFTWQKRYPSKIRVIWADVNVLCRGGNGDRCIARARGEYLAYCEGDDFWTDDKKLQKQVDLIKKTGAIGCVAFTNWVYGDGRVIAHTYETKDFVDSSDLAAHYFHTSTYVIRRDCRLQVRRKFTKLLTWYDVTLLFAVESIGKICLLPELVSVRRITGEGMSSGLSSSGFCRLLIEQHYQLYYGGPRNGARRFWGRSILGNIRALFRYNDKETQEYLKGRRLFFAGIYCGVRLREALSFFANWMIDDLGFLKWFAISLFRRCIKGLKHSGVESKSKHMV